jgi:N-acetylmuramoyl-L-alanine amidase
MHEWEFNSAVVGYMQEELAYYQNVAVLRVDDPSGKIDAPLKERTDRVNAWGSNVHVSVHGNAAGDGWSDAHGIETFVYKSSGEQFELAKKVQSELVKATGLTDRGVKVADLHMLRETKMTAILPENGFMTNHSEAELMKTDEYRKKVALAIVAGLAAQYGLKKVATAPKNGWVKDGVKWYFYKDGTMLKNNWALDSKKLWYYLGEDGSMATDKWVKWKGNWCYVGSDGSMFTGRKTINGKEYFFQDNGYLVMTDKDGAIING